MRAGIAAAALAAMAGCGLSRAVFVVDRIEEGRAILVDEDGAVTAAALTELPEGVHEGDVVVDGRRDDDERHRRVDEIRALRGRLMEPGLESTDLNLEGP